MILEFAARDGEIDLPPGVGQIPLSLRLPDRQPFAIRSARARAVALDHRTLMRASKNFSERQPSSAADCALLALYWISADRAVEVSSGENLAAVDHLVEAGRRTQCLDRALGQLQQVLDALPAGNLVRRLLHAKLERPIPS